MPELPEVETVRSLIADQALNRRIVAVDDADAFVCRPHTPGQLRDALVGRTLTSAWRRGKTMWCETSGVNGSPEPGPELGIHLGMGGRIVVTAGDRTTGGGDGGRSGAKHARPWRRALARAGRGTRPWRRARAGKRARASRNGTVSRSSSPTAGGWPCSTSAGWDGSG